MASLRQCAAARRADLSLNDHRADQPRLFVVAVTVRWARGQEYGVETVMVEKQVQSRVEHWVTRLAQESVESLP